MAELLVRVVDKTSNDFYLNLKCSKRGDVIAVAPDGWAWTTAELRNLDWRIFIVSLTVEEARAYLSPQDDGKPLNDKNKSKTLMRRKQALDLDSLLIPPLERIAISDPDRTVRRINFGAFDINSIRVIKQTVADPNVIIITP